MKLPGYIKWLKSKNTEKEFPIFIASADVDYVTDGLCAVTSIDEKLIVVGQANNEEYNLGPQEGEILFQKRANESLSRKDLRSVQVKEIKDRNKHLEGLSFQEYSRKYQEPEIVYSDPYDLNGISQVCREETIEEFMSGGGKIEII